MSMLLRKINLKAILAPSTIAAVWPLSCLFSSNPFSWTFSAVCLGRSGPSGPKLTVMNKSNFNKTKIYLGGCTLHFMEECVIQLTEWDIFCFQLLYRINFHIYNMQCAACGPRWMYNFIGALNQHSWSDYNLICESMCLMSGATVSPVCRLPIMSMPAMTSF